MKPFIVSLIASDYISRLGKCMKSVVCDREVLLHDGSNENIEQRLRTDIMHNGLI